MKSRLRILLALLLPLFLIGCADDDCELQPVFTSSSPLNPGYIQQDTLQPRFQPNLALVSFNDTALVYDTTYTAVNDTDSVQNHRLVGFCGGAYRFTSFKPLCFTDQPDSVDTPDPRNHDIYTTKCNSLGFITSWNEDKVVNGRAVPITGQATYDYMGNLLTLERLQVSNDTVTSYHFTFSYSNGNIIQTTYYRTQMRNDAFGTVLSKYKVDMYFSYGSVSNPYRQFIPIFFDNLLGTKFQQLFALGYFGPGPKNLPTKYNYLITDLSDNSTVTKTSLYPKYMGNGYNLLCRAVVYSGDEVVYSTNMQYGYR